MNSKLISYTILGAITILGWNLFLIERDKKMFDSDAGRQAILNLQKPPSSSLKQFCSNQAGWHPDCNLE